MSEHSVMRRRLEALDDAIEALARWHPGHTAGPVNTLCERISVDATKYGSTDEGEEGVWVSAGGLYGMLRELRTEVAGMAEIVERQAVTMGPATWHDMDAMEGGE